MRTGGQAVADALLSHKVERLFCVPGESYLAVLDALVDCDIDVITCRQEGGAAMMADAHAKLTGQTGICFVTRGPGATNASAGVHIASQDSTPLILFIGQVATEHLGREAFQEVDYSQFFGKMAKAVFQPMQASEIPNMVAEAFQIAHSGRMGPVVIALPEDILNDHVDAICEPLEPHLPAPPKADMTHFETLLNQATRPIAILGGTGWTAKDVAAFQAFSEQWSLPVGCSFRRQMLFDHSHPNYAGDVGIGINPAFKTQIDNADLIILIGARMGEMPSQGYTLLDIPKPKQTLIHVHPDKVELGKVYAADLEICATPSNFVNALSALKPNEQREHESAMIAHQTYLKWSTPPETGPGAVQMGPIMNWLEANLPKDAIMTNGAGNYATWLHRFHRFQKFATQAAPTSGTMGYGLPASVAAKRAFPNRDVICFAGDGCFMMHGQEFITAIRYDLPIIVLLINNSCYGTIRMHQERDFPNRVSSTDLTNPDFVALAKAYGGHGELVVENDQFAPAFERAKASGKPSIIEIKLDVEAITPTRTLSDIRGTGAIKA